MTGGPSWANRDDEFRPLEMLAFGRLCTGSNTGMLRTMTDESRRLRWEDRADWPLTFTAVLFLVAYAAPILRTDLVSPLPAIFELVAWVAWALFVVDYVARLALSRDPELLT